VLGLALSSLLELGGGGDGDGAVGAPSGPLALASTGSTALDEAFAAAGLIAMARINATADFAAWHDSA
jgi:hypothetical protein